MLNKSQQKPKPRRQHCRGMRVYGHTTTAMHDNEHTPTRHIHRITRSVHIPSILV